METSKVFGEIDSETFVNLEKIAADNGLESVEKLLSQFAEKFSIGCSVTLGDKNTAA